MLERLREKMRTGAKEAEIVRELHWELMSKHGDDHDSYEREFRRVKANLQFPDPFARHMAKRTYQRAALIFDE
jgi:hypothetical protein